jgi:hypothetical protein
MTDDEARLRRAKQAGRNAVRSGPDVFHARLTRQLAKLDRTRSATPEAARGRPRPPEAARERAGLVRWLHIVEAEQEIIAAMIADAGDEPQTPNRCAAAHPRQFRCVTETRTSACPAPSPADVCFALGGFS